MDCFGVLDPLRTGAAVVRCGRPVPVHRALV